MEYSEALKTIKRRRICPFCQLKPNEIIDESTYMYVIPARAPYAEDHLLITPKRHIKLLKELSQRELADLYSLIDTRTKKLHQQHKSVNILLRDGLISDKKCGKSINHLHFHLIPDCDIGEMTGKNSSKREFFNKETYEKHTKEIKDKFN